MKAEARNMVLAFLSCYACNEHNTDKMEKKVAEILQEVRSETEFENIVWGPAASRKKGQLVSDSLAFVVKDTAKEGDSKPSYTMVIRGTNPFSLFSWLFQDLNVSGMVPWSRQSPHTTAADAWVSKATDTAMTIHKALDDAGRSLRDWTLETAQTAGSGGMHLNVCGHSLGGLMAPTFALYLREELAQEGLLDCVDISVWAYSGPSAGNKAFADLTDVSFGTAYQVFRNPLDIVCQVWQSDGVAALPSIYSGIQMNKLEEAAFALLSEQTTDMGYTNLYPNTEIPSTVNTEKLFHGYMAQAAYQHVMPYLQEAYREAPVAVAKTLLKVLEDMFGLNKCFLMRGLGKLLPRGRRMKLLMKHLKTLE